GTTLLVGTAGQSGPAPSSTDGSRPSVLGTLQAHLRRIEVDSEWVTSLAPVVDHRYDRVLTELAVHPSRPR
ncbi:MAG: hypothetical protein L3J97_07180, partial [Thermoplasmata archaeon]|nr:hypothetical protein [Thermoplasmata archaeon]